VKCGANAKDIEDALLNCLQKSGFSMEHLKENLISFVSDGGIRNVRTKFRRCKIIP
jgi:hypothetical protein